MTDLRELAENQIGALSEVKKAEFTPDDLRAEIERLQSKLVTEREAAAKYRAQSQTVASAMFDLMEAEIVACFENMIEDRAFERRLESMIEDGINNAGVITDDDVESQIESFIDNSEIEPTGSTSFDAAVRDVVREMITDGDIVLSIDVS